MRMEVPMYQFQNLNQNQFIILTPRELSLGVF